MSARVFFQDVPDRGLFLTHPAYFDRARPLIHPEARLYRYQTMGWAMVYPDISSDVTLLESRGELVSNDSDVQLPDGQTVYAESQQDYEDWAVAKARFELSRPTLQPGPGVSMSPEELTEWRSNCHFHEFEGILTVTTVGDCLLGEIPLSRYFRAAWVATDADPKAITINMETARRVHLERIRQVRNQRLEALDVPFMRAVESGDQDQQQQIASNKQILRDIPQTFSLSDYPTPELLEQAWPDALR